MLHIFAGPISIFTEWYWTPIFFTMVYGPWIVALGSVTYVAYRIFYHGNDKPRPKLLVIKIFTIATFLVILGSVLFG